MMVTHFLSAFALVLVFEGILPFLCPDCWQNLMRKLIQTDMRSIRVIGLVSMLAGVFLLYAIHG
jgi:uncharacterized protein